MIADTPAREEVQLTDQSGIFDRRYLGGREYENVPGLAQVDGGRRWVVRPSSVTAAAEQPVAAAFDAELVRRGLIERWRLRLAGSL